MVTSGGRYFDLDGLAEQVYRAATDGRTSFHPRGLEIEGETTEEMSTKLITIATTCYRDKDFTRLLLPTRRFNK